VASAMLRFLQLSPEAKAKLLMQKANRKRDLTQERDIQKRKNVLRELEKQKVLNCRRKKSWRIFFAWCG
jgi:hypothetical protein